MLMFFLVGYLVVIHTLYITPNRTATHFIKADTIYACKIATPNVFSYIEFISLLQKVKKDHRITVNSTALKLVFACYLLFYIFFS